MRLFDRTNRSYFFIIFGNLIPLVGIVGFEWDLTTALLFYAAEICAYELVMLPKIIIHTYTKSENSCYSGFRRIMKSFAWILYHLMMFGFVLSFLIHTAFAISAGTAFVTGQDLLIFLQDNYLAVIFITGEYLFVFFNEFVRMKEYKILPPKNLDIEIGLLFMPLLAVIAVVNGFSGMFNIDSDIYQIIILVIIIGFKTFAQFLLKKRKNKLYNKYRQADE